MDYIPCNPQASPEARSVLNFLAGISGNGIVTGQHTKTLAQEELYHIQSITGKLPALCGFELLSYSPNINFTDSDEECLTEVYENQGTLQKAWEWVERKGLITFTWHWFSPASGKGKSFFAENTSFDANLALITGTAENIAFVSDLDHMAGLLKPFCERGIPILWRPFHEAEGTWFWWGSKGAQTAKLLYRFMYERYVNVHKLNNLIWVWNSPLKDDYVGDDVCDIISRDLYPPAHKHTDLAAEYAELASITSASKLCAVGEIGTIPSITALEKSRIPWSWFMTWCGEFVTTENNTTSDELIKAYTSDYSITLDKLPPLY